MPLQKLPKNEVDLGKLIVATGFEWLPKVQKIAQSGHTDRIAIYVNINCGSFKSCQSKQGRADYCFRELFGI